MSSAANGFVAFGSGALIGGAPKQPGRCHGASGAPAWLAAERRFARDGCLLSGLALAAAAQPDATLATGLLLLASAAAALSDWSGRSCAQQEGPVA